MFESCSPGLLITSNTVQVHLCRCTLIHTHTHTHGPKHIHKPLHTHKRIQAREHAGTDTHTHTHTTYNLYEGYILKCHIFLVPNQTLFPLFSCFSFKLYSLYYILHYCACLSFPHPLFHLNYFHVYCC